MPVGVLVVGDPGRGLEGRWLGRRVWGWGLWGLGGGLLEAGLEEVGGKGRGWFALARGLFLEEGDGVVGEAEGDAVHRARSWSWSGWSWWCSG